MIFCVLILYVFVYFFTEFFGFGLQRYFQVEQDLGMDSIKLKALIDLFNEIVEEPMFNQLR